MTESDHLSTPFLCAAGGVALAVLLSSSSSSDGALAALFPAARTQAPLEDEIEDYAPTACPPAISARKSASVVAEDAGGGALGEVDGWSGPQVFSETVSFQGQFEGHKRAPGIPKKTGPARRPLHEKDNKYANRGRRVGGVVLQAGRCAGLTDPTLVSDPDQKATIGPSKRNARGVMTFGAPDLLEESSDEGE